jgi:hypothetical protein
MIYGTSNGDITKCAHFMKVSLQTVEIFDSAVTKCEADKVKDSG